MKEVPPCRGKSLSQLRRGSLRRCFAAQERRRRIKRRCPSRVDSDTRVSVRKPCRLVLWIPDLGRRLCAPPFRMVCPCLTLVCIGTRELNLKKKGEHQLPGFSCFDCPLQMNAHIMRIAENFFIKFFEKLNEN